MFVPSDSIVPKLQTAEDLQGDALLHYDAEIKDIWKRVERLMKGTIQNQVDRETRFTNEFDQFVAEPGEALVSVYNRFAQLMNDLERNNMHFPIQFEKLVNASRAKKLEKSHDPLALVAHTSSSSRNTSSYYVTHPTSVVDYDDEYQNQAIIQGDRENIQSRNSGNTSTVQCYNCSGKGHYARNCLKARVRDSKYFMEQMLLAKQDEAGVLLTNEQNNFFFADASRMEEIEELSANICLMARIQPANNTYDPGPSYDSTFIRMFMLGPKSLSVYDPQLKHGLGYLNPNTLKQAISQCPKLYLASSLSNSEIPLNIRDTEDTLDDTSKNFVPQKELFAEQKYFPYSFIPSDKTPNATSSIPTSMPSESPLIIQLDNIKNYFQTLSELIQKNCKRASIFNTSLEEIQLNDFCQDQVKPIVNEFQFYFEFFRKLFQRDIKEMKDVFESTKSELYEIKKQNDFFKDQLLEASLKHEVEISVLLNHECEDNSLHAEIEQVKKNSIEIQEGLQAKIKILEKDVQRCQKQSVDFELKLQHEKEKHKWESTLKNKNTNPLDYSWISKMEKLENENVSLDFKVQSLIKERDNVKLEYQKLFDSIKKTQSQTQKEIDELITHVSEKTYAYGVIRAENRNLLSTISKLKTRLETVEKVTNLCMLRFKIYSVRDPTVDQSCAGNSE
ncbi:integrase, catalytic region, zinc finger, CCHC-type containing protein [Tanacetum coccineum]